MTESKATGRLTSKGQVTIPKTIRETLGVKYGDQVDFVEKDGAIIVKKHFDEEKFDAAVEKWRGYLSHLKGKDIDKLIDDMRGE
ncbi:MAG: AbrB/MazE/SpoVT family DNA-binding domain-containing protein [Chloroflexota bacterium]